MLVWCAYVPVKHNRQTVLVIYSTQRPFWFPPEFKKYHRDWWGINKQDQTFRSDFLYLVNTPFSRLAVCRRERMKNVSGEFTALSLTVQPLLPQLTAYNALPHLVTLAALWFIWSIIAQILGGWCNTNFQHRHTNSVINNASFSKKKCCTLV